MVVGEREAAEVDVPLSELCVVPSPNLQQLVGLLLKSHERFRRTIKASICHVTKYI